MFLYVYMTSFSPIIKLGLYFSASYVNIQRLIMIWYWWVKLNRTLLAVCYGWWIFFAYDDGW